MSNAPNQILKTTRNRRYHNVKVIINVVPSECYRFFVNFLCNAYYNTILHIIKNLIILE